MIQEKIENYISNITDREAYSTHYNQLFYALRRAVQQNNTDDLYAIHKALAELVLQLNDDHTYQSYLRLPYCSGHICNILGIATEKLMELQDPRVTEDLRLVATIRQIRGLHLLEAKDNPTKKNIEESAQLIYSASDLLQQVKTPQCLHQAVELMITFATYNAYAKHSNSAILTTDLAHNINTTNSKLSKLIIVHRAHFSDEQVATINDRLRDIAEHFSKRAHDDVEPETTVTASSSTAHEADIEEMQTKRRCK